MLKKYTYLLCSLFLIICVVSCHNDIGDVNPSSEQKEQITTPYDFIEIRGELIGFVYDKNNEPVENANVSIYSGETTTNEFGMFRFQDARLDPQGTFVKVEKSGYMLGSDLVYPSSTGKGTARITMLEIINEPAFQASEGGVVEIEGGGTVTFPPFCLIRPNGSIYDGEVKSTAYNLSPKDLELGSKMSGGLLGVDKEGRHRVLSTYSMIALELRSFDNQKLRIKSDKIAEVSLPISEEYQNLIESNTAAWNFNFQEGLWREEIVVTNDQQNFFISIDKLGYWNVASQNALSYVCGKLIYNNELPAKNYIVQVLNNGVASRIGVTDQDGYFCGKMPKEENLTLQVLHPICGGVLKELIIGPFEDVGTIGDVILESEEEYFSGRVECEGEGFENATILTSSNGRTNFFYPNPDGSFSINMNEVGCGATFSFSIFAYNNSTGMQSEPINLDNSFTETLKLEVCQTECLASAVFNYEKDNYCEDGPYIRVAVEVANGSGEYTYKWQDGSSELFFNDPVSGEICVVVTDIVTGCEYEFCDEVVNYKKVRIESIYSSNTECLITSGFVELEVEGGRGQLEYEWSGPDGYYSNEAKIENLSPGIYSLLLKDEEGCEASESVEVYDVTTPIQLSKEDFCNVSIITIEENDGYKPYTYKWSDSDAEAIGNQLFVYSQGVYNLTVTDANLCARSTSLTINKVGFLPEINTNHECEDGIVTFLNAQSEYEYYYQRFGTNDKVPLNVEAGKINIEILDAGYRFLLGADNPNFNECSTSIEIVLPNYEGLQINEVIHPSCETCEDGGIEYETNLDAGCEDCSLGEVIVLNAESGENVTELNENKILKKGEYYVVVLDEFSGCYIAHSLVVLE